MQRLKILHDLRDPQILLLFLQQAVLVAPLQRFSFAALSLGSIGRCRHLLAPRGLLGGWARRSFGREWWLGAHPSRCFCPSSYLFAPHALHCVFSSLHPVHSVQLDLLPDGCLPSENDVLARACCIWLRAPLGMRGLRGPSLSFLLICAGRFNWLFGRLLGWILNSAYINRSLLRDSAKI